MLRTFTQGPVIHTHPKRPILLLLKQHRCSIRRFGGLDQTRIQQLRQLLPQLSQLWWTHPIRSLSRRSRPWHELYLMIRLPSRRQLLRQLGRHNISKSPQYGGNSIWHFDLLVRLPSPGLPFLLSPHPPPPPPPPPPFLPFPVPPLPSTPNGHMTVDYTAYTPLPSHSPCNGHMTVAPLLFIL